MVPTGGTIKGPRRVLEFPQVFTPDTFWSSVWEYIYMNSTILLWCNYASYINIPYCPLSHTPLCPAHGPLCSSHCPFCSPLPLTQWLSHMAHGISCAGWTQAPKQWLGSCADQHPALHDPISRLVIVLVSECESALIIATRFSHSGLIEKPSVTWWLICPIQIPFYVLWWLMIALLNGGPALTWRACDFCFVVHVCFVDATSEDDRVEPLSHWRVSRTIDVGRSQTQKGSGFPALWSHRITSSTWTCHALLGPVASFHFLSCLTFSEWTAGFVMVVYEGDISLLRSDVPHWAETMSLLEKLSIWFRISSLFLIEFALILSGIVS